MSEVMAQATFAAIKAVADPIYELIDSQRVLIATLRAEVEVLKARQAIQGPAGNDGRDGVDGKDGLDGKDGTDGAVGPMGPQGKDGLDGLHGTDGKDGINGKDGESFTVAMFAAAIANNDQGIRSAISDVIKSAAAEYLKANPPAPGLPGERGADGADGHDGKDGVGLAGAMLGKDGDLVLTLTNGEIKSLGRVVGADGAPGARGADGANGQDGVGFDDLECLYDGERTFTFRFVKGDQVKEWTRTVPVMLFRSVYVEGQAYEAGDVVQFGGNLYHAKQGTSMKPAEHGANDWQLVVRRGRDGKQGPQGAPGQDGKDGKPWRP